MIGCCSFLVARAIPLELLKNIVFMLVRLNWIDRAYTLAADFSFDKRFTQMGKNRQAHLSTKRTSENQLYFITGTLLFTL